jgi:peroxiredoxin
LIGRVLPLQGVDWSEKDTTVVLYLSTTCRFCNESAPFYQRLIASKTERDFKLVAVLPQSIDEATKYLASHNIKVDQVVSTSLSPTGITGTPTLMLVTKSGVISDSWRGKLDETKENEVFAKLTN